MSDSIEPTQQEFSAAEQVAIGILKRHCGSLWTTVGSVVREIVVRPFAYLHSWWVANRNGDIAATSVAALKLSQATENAMADRVAANYFVTRNTAAGASGAVSVIMTLPSARISPVMSFDCEGVTVYPKEDYYISDSASGIPDGVAFIRSIPYGTGMYIAVIPVAAASSDSGAEVPAGTAAKPNYTISAVDSAYVSSAITGGRTAETDASLMARAEANVASGAVGSYHGFKKLLDNAPVTVDSMCVIAGEEKALFRARYNSISINPGGIVDVHVVTQRQVSSDYEDFDEGTTQTAPYKCVIDPAGDHPGDPGLIVVTGVTVDGVAATDYTVSYKAPASSVMSDDGARLSAKQVTEVTFSSAKTGIVRVSYMYMPGVSDIQEYLSADAGRFIGQDAVVKAAVPAQVKVSCSYTAPRDLLDTEIALLRKAIADYINGLPVGTGKLVFSDLHSACKSVVPDADLRVPCIMQAFVLLKTGGYDSMSSATGTLDITITASEQRWPSKLYFMYVLTEDIYLERSL